VSRISWMLFTAALACGAAITLVPTTQSAPIGERERTQIRDAVERPSPFRHEDFVHMSFRGSMDQVGEFYAKVRQEFETQKVPGMNANDRPYLVIHGDPDKSRDLNMDLGFAINGRHEVKAPLKTSRLDFAKVARFTHRGHFSELSQVHQQIDRDARGAAEDMVILQLLSYSSSNPEGIETVLIRPLK
jgi:hypothetical protein